MTEIVILASPFLASVRAEGNERNTSILGHPVSDYLAASCKSPSWTVVQDGFDVLEGDLLVLSEAAVGLTEEILFRFAGSDQPVLVDYHGIPAGLRVSAEHTALLRESLGEDFDTFYSHWVDVVQPRETDEVLDEVILDVPVLTSWLAVQMAEKEMAQRICYDWLEKGVRIDEPQMTRIAPEVEIGRGTWIQGPVKIYGHSVIGERCIVTGGSEITDCQIGDDVRVWSSVLENSVMEKGSNIGPYSHLRPGASLGEGVHIGNFVEVKKARLDEGTKAGHLAYIGDAHVGKNVNISCGVIFCNYDGKNKFHTEVGDNAFLGSNSNLVAPVEVAKDAFVAAGSTITKEVGEGELALERAKQENIPGYTEKRRKKGTL